MTEQTITTQNGFKFLIEGAADFCENGRFKSGAGWFASIIDGDDVLSGVWFETKKQAIDACYAWRG